MAGPVIVAICGIAMGLGVFPVALAALALVLHEAFAVSLAAAFGTAVLVGLCIAGLLCVLSWRRLRKETTVFQRSQAEFVRNVRWVKEVLQNEGPIKMRSNQSLGD